MHRHAVVTLVAVAACGGAQVPPGGGVTPDAAPAPVVVTPPEPPADIVALRAEIAATKDEPRLVILHGKLAAAEWATRCPAPTDGLCFQMVARSGKAPPTCDGHTEDVEVTPRPTVGEVQKIIGELRQLWGDGAALDETADPAAQAEAVAASLLILGHIEAEQLAALVPAPTEAWFRAVQVEGDDAVAAYSRVTDDPELQRWAPAEVVEAIARIGMLKRWIARDLRGMEIPPGQAATFCAALAEQAVAMDEVAAAAYAHCETFAQDAGVTGAWVDRCKAEQP